MASTVWRGYLTFGLVSIPVRLFRAARAERVSFRRMYRESPASRSEAEEERKTSSSETFGAALERRKAPPPDSEPEEGAPTPPVDVLVPVQQVSVRKGTDEVLAPKKLVKGYEYEKSRFVAIEPEELKSIAPKTATQMEIQEFVRLSDIDPVYFETSYYVTPEEAGEKAYALLYKALQTAGLVAVAQFAMHNREHVVIVRPGGKGLIAHTMFFSSEVRAEDEHRADVNAVSGKELQLAETLIHSLSAPFEPEKYRDAYREKLEAIIAKKVAGQPVEITEKPSRSADVVDIAEALQRSLAALKKPAGKEKSPAPERKAPPQSTAQKRTPSRKTAGH
jgi:DNA end-binding protein Ku